MSVCFLSPSLCLCLLLTFFGLSHSLHPATSKDVALSDAKGSTLPRRQAHSTRARPDRAPSRTAFNASRIIGGFYARYNTYSHVAFVRTFFHRTFRSCGGSILDGTRILTAAHCVVKDGSDISSGIVSIGAKRLEGEIYEFERVEIHRRYDSNFTQNDIAIVTLSSPLKRPYRTVTFPSPSFQLIPKMAVFAAGFGYTTNIGSPSDRLRVVKLCYQSYWTCAKLWAPFFRAHFNKNRIMCATDPLFPHVGRKGTCSGDSGGPLFIKVHNGKPNGMLQLGITSFAQGQCVFKASTTFYTNLQTFAPDVRAFLRGSNRKWKNVFPLM